jgi:hypothetical protein
MPSRERPIATVPLASDPYFIHLPDELKRSEGGDYWIAAVPLLSFARIETAKLPNGNSAVHPNTYSTVPGPFSWQTWAPFPGTTLSGGLSLGCQSFRTDVCPCTLRSYIKLTALSNFPSTPEVPRVPSGVRRPLAERKRVNTSGQSLLDFLASWI